MTCFWAAFIHTESHGDNGVICVLPSPLHARYVVPVLTAPYYMILSANNKRFVEHYYGQSFAKPFPFQMYPDFSSICLGILRRFSKEMLCKTRNGHRLGPSGRTRPPEACFQDEFYRYFWEETGFSRYIK